MCTNSTSPGSLVRRTVAALVVLVAGVAAVNIGGSGAGPQPAPPAPAVPAPPSPLPSLSTTLDRRPAGPPGALFGAYVQGAGNGADAQMAAVESRERDLGRRLAIDHHFYPWDKEFPTAREEADLEAGRVPMISWNGTLNLGIDLGLQDDLIKTRADAVKALPGKVMIRWMWEMDGRRKANDSGHPALYVAAWRHIHDVFTAEGATNVQWVWCPNATAFADDRNAPSYYPGDEYVDWICADGYNWAPGRQGDQWRSFPSIYGAFYDWGMAHAKPLMVGEYGAQERNPGDKAQWLTDARESLKTQFPGIKAVLYFDANHDFDWRVSTSPESLAAFRAMANDPWFTPDPHPLLDAASAAPAVPGIPIPIPPLQFLPQGPPKPPSAPPKPPTAPDPPSAPEPPG